MLAERPFRQAIAYRQISSLLSSMVKAVSRKPLAK
jgi:hypothetical protein